MLAASAAASAVFAETQTAELAPGWSELAFELPEAGSYELPPLGKAGDGEVLTDGNVPARLHTLFDNKIVLLSFIYSTCSDVNGCPLATAVLYKVKQRLQDEPELAQRLKLISLSFDPQQDTPEVMKLYGAGFQGDGVEWDFVTTRSERELQPLLDAYQQHIIPDYGAQGDYLGTISHILRVFLIDTQRQIRNIYSVSYLHADTIINDIKTIALEDHDQIDTSATSSSGAVLARPGDDKSGYESADYRTHSLSLAARKGAPADLLQIAEKPPLGLPPVPLPDDNLLTEEKIQLGRKLFYDRRLSLNDTFSCAMCHIPEQGFTSNELAVAVGFEGRSGRRNAPTLYNVAYATRLFHDGREYTLENQIWSPMLAANEMANPSIGWLVEKIKSMPDYQGLFERAFEKGPTVQTIGMALASYERTLLSGNSAFDRWYYGKDETALNDSEKRGFQLFTGKGNCASCHLIGAESALFTDNRLHNTGHGYYQSMKQTPKKMKLAVAPGVVLDVDTTVIAAVTEPPPNDVGLYEITQNPHDRWKYKTPSLRNVALTAPYMHDGSLATLQDVIAFYNRGGVQNELLDPLLKPLNLSEQESADLVAFLKALTGDNVDVLVADAFAAPVGDLRKEDPHWSHGTQIAPD